jgi:putative membrane protein
MTPPPDASLDLRSIPAPTVSAPRTLAPVLLGVYLVWWTVLAIEPVDRLIWVFENLLVVAGLPVVVFTYRRFTFSGPSYVAMFAFLMVHALGAHYGYTKVPIPWEEWGFARNHSDRVVHFLFGSLAAVPVRELLRRLAGIQGRWLDGLTVACVFALAAGFEVVEWLAVVVGGELAGPQEGGYLGTQGDAFDAVKDMALGLAGATTSVVAMAVRVAGRPGDRSRVE